MANQVVAHVTKYSEGSLSSGGLGRHIDREHVPKNADPGRQEENFQVIEPKAKLKDSIDQRIKEGYKGKTAIRKDAIRSVGVIFSGSHDQMMKIKDDPELMKKWSIDTYKFAADRWGKDNIVRATVHMDEKTPHMHLHFVPLTEDGRLSAKDIINKKNLKALQNDYAKVMQPYGLSRGMEGSKQQHITTKQYYQKENELQAKAEQIIKHPQAKVIVTDLLRENEDLKRKAKLKKDQEDPKIKKEQIKTNPDKENQYEKSERARVKQQPTNQPSRGKSEEKQPARETKQTHRGIKF